jgi:putative oxidoreductase
VGIDTIQVRRQGGIDRRGLSIDAIWLGGLAEEVVLSMDDRLHGRRLGPLFLRIGLGVLTIIETWPKVTNPEAVISLWQTLHLPGPSVLGYGFEIAKFGGGLLLVVGLLTRLLGLFFALAMAGEILATKTPLGNPSGWTLEWQSFWMSLALLVLGAGSVSLDAFLRGGKGHPCVNPRRDEDINSCDPIHE